MSYDLEANGTLDPQALPRVADELVALDPSAERHEEDGEVEIHSGLISIELDAEGAFLSVPYGGGDTEGEIERLYAFAEVLHRHGYTVHDPQLDEDLVFDDDQRERADRKHRATGAAVFGDPPPRWKFWKR